VRKQETHLGTKEYCKHTAVRLFASVLVILFEHKELDRQTRVSHQLEGFCILGAIERGE
jgi:hypothetical protein